MKLVHTRTKAARNQGGYALMLVVFFVALLAVGTMSVGLRILTEGRREKETEMIWRGKQYTRGVKLYYQKLGRFPNSMDDLVKPKLGNLRFMRQAYKDPMNKEDGSWRLIYVGPAGQLIGSLKPQPGGIQMPTAGGTTGGIGTPAPTSGFGTQPGTAPTGTPPGTAPTGMGAPGTGTPATGTGTGALGTDSNGTGTDQPIPGGDTPTIIGGNIIGVGSKVNKSSIMVYDKAHNYRLFEFIWDPSKDAGMVGGAAPTVGAPTGAPGTSPTGTQPNPAPNPLNPPATAPTSPPNPPQQQ